VDREFAATRAVHAAELPVPAAYEVVEVDGRRGIVFERIDEVSMLKYTQARPWTIFGAARLLAELHAQIHCCTAPAGLPTLRERIAVRIEAPTRRKRTSRLPWNALPTCQTGQRWATATSIPTTSCSPHAVLS
jgi:hypothetical protein